MSLTKLNKRKESITIDIDNGESSSDHLDLVQEELERAQTADVAEQEQEPEATTEDELLKDEKSTEHVPDDVPVEARDDEDDCEESERTIESLDKIDNLVTRRHALGVSLGSVGGVGGGVTRLGQGAYLEEGTERSSTYRTIVGLISETVGTGVAQTEMTTGKYQGIPHIAHAHHTLSSSILHLVFIATKCVVRKFVLDTVNFLQQIAKSVYKEFLFDGFQRIVFITLLLDNGEMRLSGFLSFLCNTVDSDREDITVGDIGEVSLVRFRDKDVFWLTEQLASPSSVLVGGRHQTFVSWSQNQSRGRNFFCAECIDRDGYSDIAVKRELDVVLFGTFSSVELLEM